jgi:hypothetical protein
VYLRFVVPRDAFDKLVPERLARETAKEMDRSVPLECGGVPEWWDYRNDSQWVYYLRKTGSRHGFGEEVEYFAFDPATQTAYYHFTGID